eukprot:GHVU01138625.1.p1 GENE.GHVU01138625.1~~GHVU01138625.1.p1  ORF type:complete len:125 (-),score=7.72 GHVU01138625.1:170-544(-)
MIDRGGHGVVVLRHVGRRNVPVMLRHKGVPDSQLTSSRNEVWDGESAAELGRHCRRQRNRKEVEHPSNTHIRQCMRFGREPSSGPLFGCACTHVRTGQTMSSGEYVLMAAAADGTVRTYEISQP